MIKYTTIESSILTFGRLLNIIKGSQALGLEKEYKDFTDAVFERLSTYTDTTGLGVLWNALTEKNTGHLVQPRCSAMDIHVDSGGLQQITLGLDVDEKFRKTIYEKQSLLGTHAMSFDVMPIRMKHSDDKKNRLTDHSEKYMILDLLYESGAESAYNVIEQYKVFKAASLTKKPDETVSGLMVIFQGSTYENYETYAKGMFDKFKEVLSEDELEDMYTYIRGVAIGLSGSTNYFDLFDLIIRLPMEMTFIPERIRSEIHFLGLGGITKVAPLYALNENFYGRDVVFTFDSTSRTNSSTYGTITTNTINGDHIKRQQKTLGRDYSLGVEKYLEVQIKEWGDIINKTIGFGETYDLSDVTKYRNRFSPFREDKLRLIKELEEKFGENKAQEIKLDIVGVHDFLLWASELLRFFEVTDAMKKRNFKTVSKREIREACDRLKDVKDYQDYMKQREIFYLTLKNVKMNNINIVQTYDEYKNPEDLSIDTW